MSPQVPEGARAVAEKAREVIAKVRPGALEGRRSLPIRREPAEVQGLWSDPATRAAVLDGIPATDASIEIGAPAGDWGTTVSLRLQLSVPVPGIGSQVLAGKAVRRLKALAETGEMPTTSHNPSARRDAGEPTS